MEQWRSIVGFPGYQVSDEGRVRSFKRGGLFPAILKPSRANKQRRALFTLYRGTKKPYYRLGSRLVCEAFNGAPPTPQHQAAHSNGDCTDDRAGNLEWKTPLQNIADRDAHGRTQRGNSHYAAKLTEAQVIDIRAAYARWKASGKIYGKVTKLAVKYGVSLGCIHDVIYERKWRSAA